MMRSMLLAGVLLALAVAAGAPVAAAHPGESLDHQIRILPYRGMYHEVGHGGTGLSLDVDANGEIFAQFYAYDDAGAQRYYLIQGDFVGNDVHEIMRTGITGTYAGGAYLTRDGQCTSAECAWRRPELWAPGNKLVPVHITWRGPRHAEVTIDARTFHMKAGVHSVSEADLLLGNWLGTVLISIWPETPMTGSLLATQWTIERTTLRRKQFSGCGGDDFYDWKSFELADVPEDAVIYRLAHSDNGRLREAFFGQPMYLFHAPDEDRWGAFLTIECPDAGHYSEPAYATRIFVTGPNEIVGLSAFVHDDNSRFNMGFIYRVYQWRMNRIGEDVSPDDTVEVVQQ